MPIKRLSKPLRPQKILLVAVLVVAAVAIAGCVVCRKFLWSPVLNLDGDEKVALYIPTGATYDDVVVLLSADGKLAEPEAFGVMAWMMGYPDAVKPGKYTLSPEMSARGLVSMLRGGMQTPVRVTFSVVRDVERLAGVVSRYVEADSSSLLCAMRDTALAARFGFKPETAVAMYMPDSYEVWWNISSEAWVERMAHEYGVFWDERRRAKADSIGLTPVEVCTLASIVEEESNNDEDRKIIAGLYLNRLRMGMPLQACPTVKYALGDFTMRRVTLADTQVDSPYNTYVNKGLPPGPIRITSKRAIETVLNYAPSDYLYMCARPDGSGLHDFARTLAQHQVNAARYHKALNKKNIYR